MKSAHYHQAGKQPIAFTVAKTHPNGTVDLADAAGVVKISECEVTTDGAPGTCSLVEDTKAKAEADAKAKAEADAKTKAEADAKTKSK